MYIADIGTKIYPQDRLFERLIVKVASTSTFSSWFNLVETY